MTRRVYLPFVLAELADVAATGQVEAGTAFAVTDAQRRAAPGEDEEDLEVEAMCAALDAAAGRRHGPTRRVVVSADVEHADDAPGAQGWAVRLDAPVPLSDVVSWHVEEAEGTPEGEGYDDLLWYDVAELPDLVGG